MSPKKVIKTEKAPAPVGPYSQGIDTGTLLFVSGQIPINMDTGEIVTGDIQTATKLVLDNIQAVVEEAGYSMVNVVRCTVYLKNLDDFGAMNDIYSQYFKDSPPARVAIEASKLPKDVDIEISAIVVK